MPWARKSTVGVVADAHRHWRYYSFQRRAPEQSSEVTELLNRYESTTPLPLNLAQLLAHGHPVTPDSVLSSVTYALSELPRRMATRVRSLEGLPFIVGTNPYVAKMLQSYRESFRFLATYRPVTSLEENDVFVQYLTDLVQGHANDIPTLAKGFQECSRYMSPKQISDFLDGAIRNRISVRLIAEQHIAVSQAMKKKNTTTTTTTANLNDTSDAYVGVVDMHCSPKDMIKTCEAFVTELCEATLGSSPSILVDGYTDATFAYIPVHLEYIFTEILKNSFRATVEHHQKRGSSSSSPLPSVIVTIAPPRLYTDPKTSTQTSFLSMRIRDQGGGVTPSNMARIFSYAFTTAGRGAEGNLSAGGDGGGPYAAQHVGGGAAIGGGGVGGSGGGNMLSELAGTGLQSGMGTIAGLGYGLPMSRLYASYFGGSLDFFSLDGWGSDVYVKLRCLDEAGDSKI